MAQKCFSWDISPEGFLIADRFYLVFLKVWLTELLLFEWCVGTFSVTGMLDDWLLWQVCILRSADMVCACVCRCVDVRVCVCSDRDGCTFGLWKPVDSSLAVTDSCVLEQCETGVKSQRDIWKQNRVPFIGLNVGISTKISTCCVTLFFLLS